MEGNSENVGHCSLTDSIDFLWGSPSSGSRTQSRDFAEKGTQTAQTEDVNKESWIWMLGCIRFFLCVGDGMFRSVIWVSYPGNPCDKGFLLWDIPRRVKHKLQPSTLTRQLSIVLGQFFQFSSPSHLGSRQVECAQRSAEGEVNERFWWFNFKLTDSGVLFLHYSFNHSRMQCQNA